MVILHDLNLAAMYGDRVVILVDGGVLAEGPPGEVLTEPAVLHAFDLAVMVTTHPTRGVSASHRGLGAWRKRPS